ncbi:hypothetical protein AVEN_142414-1, partial [Araneus ventricosus]
MSARVVRTLTKPLLDKGYCLTMDNFYNSPDLADTLIKRKTDVCGTLRLNRKDLSQDPKTKKLKKVEIIAYQRVNLALWNSFILYYKAGVSRSPKQFRMGLVDKLIAENHGGKFSGASERTSISPSPLRLTSRHFPDVISATEKKNPKSQCALCCCKRDSR